jgi:hypothetical protein
MSTSPQGRFPPPQGGFPKGRFPRGTVKPNMQENPMPNQTLLPIGAKVRIDGDLIGLITEIIIRGVGGPLFVLYKVEWVHNGANQEGWFTELRLSLLYNRLGWDLGFTSNEVMPRLPQNTAPQGT